MQKLSCFLGLLLLCLKVTAQLSGTYSVPANFASIGAAITALNAQGVSGAVTIFVLAGHTETASSGGYSLTATGNSLNTITFQKTGTGANPLIVAYSGGNGTPGSANQDGIWRLIGCDYITIDGIDLSDPNTSNPATMEFGFGLCKAGVNDGCQHNTIRNCVVTLNKINNASGAAPAVDGSRGIDMINALTGSYNSLMIPTSANGSNSYNKFYANTIQNCNVGIALIGYQDSSPYLFADTGNEIGGTALSSGNAILNFGGGTSTSTNAAAGIRTLAQYNLSIGYNTINNNNGSGINHTATLRGIFNNTANGANAGIFNNTITINGGGTSSQISAIENNAGSASTTNSISILNNLITNSTYTGATSGSFYGINNTASCSSLTINGNRFLNNSSAASSGANYLIYNSGAVVNSIQILNNHLSFSFNSSLSYSGNFYGIYNSNGSNTTTLGINSNTFSSINYSGNTGTGNLYFINNSNDCMNAQFNANIWQNLNLNHSGSEHLILNTSSTQQNLSVTGNSIISGYTRSAATGNMYLYNATGSSPATCMQTITLNNFSNISSAVAGTGAFYGIYNVDGASNPYPKKLLSSNMLSNINMNGSGNFYGYYLDNYGEGPTTAGSAVVSNTLSDISRSGIAYGFYLAGNSSSTSVSNVLSNKLINFNSSGVNSGIFGFYLNAGGSGISVSKNRIADVIQTGTAGVAHGIYLAAGASASLINNYVGNVQAPNSSAPNAVNGIYINGGNYFNLNYNTVFLNATGTGTHFASNALYSATTASLSLRNNIFVNLSVPSGTGIVAAYRRSSTNLSTYQTNSNNNIFYAGTPSANRVILVNGTSTYSTLTAYQTLVGLRDANSFSQAIPFITTNSSSSNFLHLVPNVASLAESGAIGISGITDDQDSDIRAGNTGYTGTGTAPDIGADEFEQNLNPCASANAGTISPLSFTLCAGQSASLVSTGFTPGTGLLHQWKQSNSSGGPYVNVPGGVGASSTEYYSPALTAGTYYFILQTTCTNVPTAAISNEATLTVNALPTASVSINNATVCAGQSINLMGNSANGSAYNWTGPAGFNSSLQTPSISNVNNVQSGIYYLSVSNANCSSATQSLAVAVSEVSLSVVTSASTICLGSSATLSAMAAAVSYSWSNGSGSSSLAVSPSVTSVYTVTATNSINCAGTNTILLSVINPSITAIGALVCGSAAVATLAVNAFSTATVNWYASSSPANPIASGTTYTVNGTAAATVYAQASSSMGCNSSVIPVTLTVSSIPVITLTSNSVSLCPGATATISAFGASTYSWLSGQTTSLIIVSISQNTLYTVLGKNQSGCTTTQSIGISTFSVPLVVASKSVSSVCPSAPMSFSASGASTYTWSNGASGPVMTVSPAISSVYSVTGTSSDGCSATASIAITTKSVPLISIAQSVYTICAGEAVTFTASGASIYKWLPGTINSAYYSVNPIVSSVYNAIGTSINSCTNIGFASVQVESCTTLKDEISIPETYRLYPNPSNGRVTVIFGSSKERTIKIYNNLSQEKYRISTSDENNQLDLGHLPKGSYLVCIYSSGLISHLKFILE